MRKTKIVCTLGPATEERAIIRDMILAGMNVARLNFSHGTYESHLEKARAIKELREELGVPVALLLDTRGPEIRIKTFRDGGATLTAGAPFTLTSDEVEGDESVVSVTYAGLPAALSPGDRILLDDGLFELVVDSTCDKSVNCTVVNGGYLGNRKSINIPGVKLNMPYLSQKDREDILFGAENGFDYIALSFVRTAEDVLDVRRLLQQHNHREIELISKIENGEGVENVDDIIKYSHGIMVARGDMGVEIPLEELPHIQKTLIKKVYRAGKKVITATQMLESMVRNPRPTRAEVTDIANAIHDGTSALMLSGETANGKYPLESIRTMARIAESTEACIDYRTRFNQLNDLEHPSVSHAISHATCTTAQDLNAKAIVTVTRSGSSARMISSFRPPTSIIAVTPHESTYQKLALSWGVTPLKNAYVEDSTALFSEAIDRVQEAGLAGEGDLIVITGSSEKTGGITNTMRVHILGNVLVQGTGNGLLTAYGRACVDRGDGSLVAEFKDGDILVIRNTTDEILRLLKRSGGLITEEQASVSEATAAGIALDLPMIFGAENATTVIRSGVDITMDAARGFVYNGQNIPL